MASLCGYCGGRVARVNGSWVHATDGNRVKNISPGDYASPGHNRRGARVGSYDIVNSNNVRGYLIMAAHAYSDDLTMIESPWSLPGRRGAWTLRAV